MSATSLVRRHSDRSGLSISTSTDRWSHPRSALSPSASPSSHASSASTTSRSSSVVSITAPARRPANLAQLRRLLKEDQMALRSVSYSAAREAVWEDELGSMQRLDIKPDAYSEPHSSAMEGVEEDDDVEVELEVKRARGGSDGQHTQVTSLILHRKRRWLQPNERSALLSHQASSPSSDTRPPLPHRLVATRTRPAVRCLCQSDGEWQPERLLFTIDKPDDPRRRVPVHLPHADLYLERDEDWSDAHMLLMDIYSLDSQRRDRTYHLAVHLLHFGSGDTATAGDGPDDWQKPPIRLTLSHSGSQHQLDTRVTTALHTTTYKRLTVQVDAQRMPHAPNFSTIRIQLDTPHSPQLLLELTPTLIRGVEYSGVTGELVVGEKHWSEEGDVMYDEGDESDEEEEAERRVENFEQRVEMKRRRVADKKIELDAAADQQDIKAREEARNKQRASIKEVPWRTQEQSSIEHSVDKSKVFSLAKLTPMVAKAPFATSVTQAPAPRPPAPPAPSAPPSAASVAVRPPLPPPTIRRVTEPSSPPNPSLFSRHVPRPTPPHVSASPLAPSRSPSPPPALAPVSLSSWGSVRAGDTASEDCVASSEEVGHTSAATRAQHEKHKSGQVRADAAPRQPATAASTRPSSTPAQPQPAMPALERPLSSPAVSSSSSSPSPSSTFAWAVSVNNCINHVHMHPSQLPRVPSKFDPRPCRKCGRYRDPPPEGWRSVGRPRKVVAFITSKPATAATVASASAAYALVNSVQEDFRGRPAKRRELEDALAVGLVSLGKK